jgi:hypothetical protein
LYSMMRCLIAGSPVLIHWSNHSIDAAQFVPGCRAAFKTVSQIGFTD